MLSIASMTMRELPVRKHPRLKGFDYSQCGSYYVTFCVIDRWELLGRVVVAGPGFHAQPVVELTDIGIEVQKTIEYIRNKDKYVDIPKYVVMPDHVHMIVVLGTPAVGDGTPSVGDGTPTLQSVVGRIKSYTAKIWCEMGGTKFQTFWQRSFHDRIIRNEAEYQRIWHYIDKNPARWYEDRHRT